MSRLRSVACLVAIVMLVACGPNPGVEPSAESSPSSLSPSPGATPRARNATHIGVVNVRKQGISVDPGPGVRMHTDESGAVELNLSLADRETEMLVLEVLHPPVQVEQQGELVVFAAPDGVVWGVMASPRARDEAGETVGTRVAVADRQIFISCQPDDDVRLPLQVTVQLGRELIESVQVAEERGQPRYIIRRTSFGRAVFGDGLPTASTRALFEGEGWAQAKAMEPRLAGSASLKQQFDCHVLGAAAKETWNLEAFRPANPDWLAGAVQHRCNWESA